jgi:hypothetical protein
MSPRPNIGWLGPLGLLALALAACADSRRVDVVLPAVSGARTVVLSVEGDVASGLWVLDPSRPSPIPLVLPDDGALSLAYAAYEELPEVLGLALGPLVPRTDGGPLPTSRLALQSARLDADDTFSGWSPLTTLPTSLEAVRVLSACARFRATPFGVPAGGDGGVLEALPDGTALGSTFDGPFFRISPAGLTPLALPDTLPRMLSHTAADGALWLFGRQGQAATGTLETGFREVPSAPEPHELVALTVVPGSTRALDLFVLSSRGDLYRFDGARWTSLVDAPDDAEVTLTRAVAAASADDVLYSSRDNHLTRWRPGGVTLEVPTEPGGERDLEAVTYVPDLGYVVGTSLDGRYYREEAPGKWARVLGREGQDATLRISVDALFPFEDGFFVTGGLGATQQYSRALGFCPVGPSVANNSVSRARWVGRDLVLLTESSESVPASAVWMTRL